MALTKGDEFAFAFNNFEHTFTVEERLFFQALLATLMAMKRDQMKVEMLHALYNRRSLKFVFFFWEGGGRLFRRVVRVVRYQRFGRPCCLHLRG